MDGAAASSTINQYGISAPLSGLFHNEFTAHCHTRLSAHMQRNATRRTAPGRADRHVQVTLGQKKGVERLLGPTCSSSTDKVAAMIPVGSPFSGTSSSRGARADGAARQSLVSARGLFGCPSGSALKTSERHRTSPNVCFLLRNTQDNNPPHSVERKPDGVVSEGE